RPASCGARDACGVLVAAGGRSEQPFGSPAAAPLPRIVRRSRHDYSDGLLAPGTSTTGSIRAANGAPRSRARAVEPRERLLGEGAQRGVVAAGEPRERGPSLAVAEHAERPHRGDAHLGGRVAEHGAQLRPETR